MKGAGLVIFFLCKRWDEDVATFIVVLYIFLSVKKMQIGITCCTLPYELNLCDMYCGFLVAMFCFCYRGWVLHVSHNSHQVSFTY